jgi:hypothetical protein
VMVAGVDEGVFWLAECHQVWAQSGSKRAPTPTLVKEGTVAATTTSRRVNWELASVIHTLGKVGKVPTYTLPKEGGNGGRVFVLITLMRTVSPSLNRSFGRELEFWMSHHLEILPWKL